MNAQLDEIISFLDNDRVDVREEAAKIVASQTTNKETFEYFKNDEFKQLANIMGLIRDEAAVSHQIINALINLSSDVEIAKFMAIEKFLYDIILYIVLPKCVFADLCCMLLNNLSKQSQHISILLEKPSNLDALLEVFCKKEKDYNTHANFDFLAGVWANLSSTPGGAEFLLEKSSIDGDVRLARLVLFTRSNNLVRRGGVLSTLKNTCFLQSSKSFDSLFNEEKCDLLTHIVLPLMDGSDEYDIDDMEKFPTALQFLEDNVTREGDPKLRQILLECLLLIASTRMGRDLLREKNIYRITQKLHLVEKSEGVKDVIEKIVDLIQGNEELEVQHDSKIEEISSDEDEEVDQIV